MEAFLSERGIEFLRKDVSQDREAVRELVGVYKSRSTPTIVIGDVPNQQVMVGFDEDALLAAILN